MEKVYYVDPMNGMDQNSGLSPEEAIRDYRQLTPCPGDTVLFRRGCVLRGPLRTVCGDETGVITYGAYGKGEKPRFLGSAEICDPTCWEEIQPNIWRYCGAEIPEVGNIVLNDEECCANMCWEPEEMSKQGDWYDSHAGIAEDGELREALEGVERRFLFYSEGNPAKVYSKMECSLVKDRTLLQGNRYVTVEDLCFAYNGVHGLGETRPEHLLVRNCEFRFLGGAVWNRKLKIRFGNGFEIWEGGKDIRCENNRFYEIYDSCVTHQGSEECEPVWDIYFVGNVFEKYGMAAYEARDMVGYNIHFDNNICIGAGEGFALQNETPPRRSEIWPQPMGHHLFLWRIPQATEGGSISVKGNVFYRAPLGAAIYSIISPEAEAQFEIDSNFYYQTPDELLIHMNGKSYSNTDFDAYRAETGKDMHSMLLSERE